MKIEMEVPEYGREGLRMNWDDDFEIAVEVQHGAVRIAANPAGLHSLARQLLLLAQDGVPHGRHLHLDENSPLEPGSCSLILERSD
jgi:hypothetical protein